LIRRGGDLGPRGRARRLWSGPPGGDEPGAMASTVATSPAGRRPAADAHLPDLSGRPGLLVRTGVGVVTAAGWGLLAAAWTPRGPQTTGESVGSVVLGLVV